MPALPGHTQGRSLRAAQCRIREALALFVADADAVNADLAWQWKLPATVRASLRRLTEARRVLDQATATFEAASRDAYAELDAMGVSQRDAATLLGVSHQRVGQKLAQARTRSPAAGGEAATRRAASPKRARSGPPV